MPDYGGLFVVFKGTDLPGGGTAVDDLSVRVRNQAEADDLTSMMKAVNDRYEKIGLGGISTNIVSSINNIPGGTVVNYADLIKAFNTVAKTDPKSAAGFLNQLLDATEVAKKDNSIYDKLDANGNPSGGQWTQTEVNGEGATSASTRDKAQADVSKGYAKKFGQLIADNKLKTAIVLGGAGITAYAGIMQAGTNGKKINIEKIDIVDVPEKGTISDTISNSLNAVVTYNTLTLVDAEKDIFKLVIGDELTFSSDPSFGVLNGKTFPISKIVSSSSVKIKLNVEGALSPVEARQIADNTIDDYCGGISPCPGGRQCTVKSDFVNHLANAVSAAVQVAAVFSFLVAKNILTNSGLPTDPNELADWLAAMIASALKGIGNAAGGAGRVGKFILCNTIPILCNKTIWIALVGFIIAFIILSTVS